MHNKNTGITYFFSKGTCSFQSLKEPDTLTVSPSSSHWNSVANFSLWNNFLMNISFKSLPYYLRYKEVYILSIGLQICSNLGNNQLDLLKRIMVQYMFFIWHVQYLVEDTISISLCGFDLPHFWIIDLL